MKKKAFLSLILFFVLFFVFSSSSFATNIQTKIFFNDLQKCQQFVNEQFNLIMEFLNALTDEDVKILNNSGGYGEVEIYNRKAFSAFQKLCALDTPFVKDCDSKGCYGGNGIARDFLEGNIYNICRYDYCIELYEIPEDDYREAFSKYASYQTNLLDKLQQLMDKVKTVGLNIPRLIRKINNENCWHYNNYADIFMISKSLKYFDEPLTLLNNSIFNEWKSSTELFFELYSNKDVLTSQKLLLEFLLLYNLAYQYSSSIEEKVLMEIDLIEKQLAKLTVPLNKEENIKSETDIKSVETSAYNQKNKFKLDLPE